MAYTEIKENKYYYRVRTLREGGKFRKKRIYLGKDLSGERLKSEEKRADKILNSDKENSLKYLIPKIKNILIKNKVKKAGIFGSYARGKEKKWSDIDIVIDPPKGMGLGFVSIALELEDKLQKKVDLVTYKSIHPLLKKRISEEEIRII